MATLAERQQAIRDQLVSDADMAKGISVGTFRWKRGKKMEPMPLFQRSFRFPPLLRGWQTFLTDRCGPDKTLQSTFVQNCQIDPSIIDGLSYPLTLLFALQQIGITPETLRQLVGPEVKITLDVIVCGAAGKAEQSLLVDSDYWAEVGYHFSDCEAIKLWMVGPEAVPHEQLGVLTTAGLALEIKQRLQQGDATVSKQGVGDNKLPFRLAPNMTSDVFVGTTDDFFKAHPAQAHYYTYDAAGQTFRMSVVVGFNPGFGAGIPKLMQSWTKSLNNLAELGIPAIFSQANDYSDLRGELTVLSRLVGVKFILSPMKNPHAMATVAQGQRRNVKKEGWSCGNSFIYCFQGLSTTNKLLPLQGKRLQQVLKKTAAELREAEAAGGLHHVPTDFSKLNLHVEVASLEIPVLMLPKKKKKKKKKKKERTEDGDEKEDGGGGGTADNDTSSAQPAAALNTQPPAPKKKADVSPFVRIAIAEDTDESEGDEEVKPAIVAVPKVAPTLGPTVSGTYATLAGESDVFELE